MGRYICSIVLLNLIFISFLSFEIQAQQVSDQDLKVLFKKNAFQLHIEPGDVDNAVITNSFTDDKTAIQYVYLQQSFQNLKVFNSIISIAIKNNQLVYSSGRFIKNIAGKAGSPNRSVEGIEAINKAALHLRLSVKSEVRIVEDRFSSEKKMIFTPSGIAKKNIETELMWVSDDDGSTVKLAWNVNIDVLNSTDWWNVRVDAVTGDVISKDNWTVNDAKEFDTWNDHIPAVAKNNFIRKFQPVENEKLFMPPNVTNGAYRVVPYPVESPNHGSIVIDNEPWLNAGAMNNATTNGWHFDGTSNYTTTRGNNVYAYEDADANNASGVSPTSSTAVPGLTFNSSPDFGLQPATSTNQNFALANLFYWNNLIHDLTYQYGFTEAAGNFQMNNLGRGGSGNDHVLAEAQDGSGLNNANFSTPSDGFSPRMQMYLFSTPLTFTVISPSAIAGQYPALENVFIASNKLRALPTNSITGEVVLYNDDAGGTLHEACAPAANAAQLAGKIALINSATTCSNLSKVKKAQNAGAIAVIVYHSSNALFSMTGADNTITIPAILVGITAGNQIISQLGSGPVTITMTSGIYLDGDLDNGIVVHEYGHGVSNRLTGGPANSSCLSNPEQGGEGWSDYLALMMTTNWSTAQLTDGPLLRPIGTYAINQPTNGTGIRVYPYTSNMAINPLTYNNMSSNGQVHFIGTIWCSALWDMTWNIIQQQGNITPDLYNSAAIGGNVIALKLVMEGMKLQPCNPGFLDARNAILAADSILFNGTYKCAIWNAFARRGMGLSALQGSPNNTSDQTAAFDVPSGITLTKSSAPVETVSGNNITINLTATCNCQAPLNNYLVRDTIPAGFTYVSSSSGGSLSGNIVTFSPVSFTTARQIKSYSITLSANMIGCNVDEPVKDDRDINTAGGLTSSSLTGTSNWVSSTLRANSGSNSWRASDAATETDFVLTSNTFTAGNLSVLSFWHYFNTENTYDGGVVEISTNGGASWSQDAGPYIIQNPYTTVMDANTTLNGRKAFSGNSNGFIRTIINLSSYNGQAVKIRFRMTTDLGNPGVFQGWFIDDIYLTNGCGKIMKAALFNSSGIRVDTTALPVFVTPAISLPVTLVSFTAKQVGKDVSLNWLTMFEINTKEYSVERSHDGINWTEMERVPSKGRSGSNNYQLFDYNALPGINYYRIKMIDNDLRFQYSGVRLVKFSGQGNASFVVIPNPANQKATLYFNTDIKSPQILIHDMSGKLFLREVISGIIRDFSFETPKLAPGTYIITVRSATNITTQKLVVAR